MATLFNSLFYVTYQRKTIMQGIATAFQSNPDTFQAFIIFYLGNRLDVCVEAFRIVQHNFGYLACN